MPSGRLSANREDAIVMVCGAKPKNDWKIRAAAGAGQTVAFSICGPSLRFTRHLLPHDIVML